MFGFTVLMILLYLFTTVVEADEVHTLLQAADRYRIPDGDVVVETEVKQYKQDKLKKERRYSVYLKPQQRSLVLFRHPSEAGQKVLMVDEKFWMILPSSRRPVRITPMQKLLGEASTGDIATLTWSDDYRGRITARDQEVIALELEATGKGSSYQRVELFLDSRHHYPLRANLYLASGKLAKQARYLLGEMEGESRIVGMVLEDRLSNHARTEVNYLSIRQQSIEARYFNPMFLVRNRADSVQ